ncbi:MAG: prolipoprotein diacylglyceryl transferase [Clostridia bacterium]|nr:prolipoprotein diacylglyceryl transferase [Clostridia bacterium]
MSIRIAGIEIRLYAVAIVLGILAGLTVAARREKRLGLPADTALDLVLWCVPAAIVGARLYYCLFSLDTFAHAPLSAWIDIRSGGLAVYGGLIAALLTGALYARIKHISFLRLADLAAPGIALGQAIGRWGNFFNKEAFGIEITDPHLQFFPIAVKIGERFHCATFFYESLWCVIICVTILLLERKKTFEKGNAFLLYIAMYAFERMFVEGLRTDSLMWGAFRVSQLLSLLLLLIAVALLVFRRNRQ